MTEIVDLDKEFGFADDHKEPKPIPIKLFGREWHLKSGVNNYTFTRLVGGDVAAVGAFIAHAVIDSEQSAWEEALNGAPIDDKKLAELVKRLVEVVSANPTKSPSASPSSASKRTSPRKSVVASS